MSPFSGAAVPPFPAGDVRFASTTCLLVAALCVAPPPARADVLHVFGPEGSGTERRGLAVVEVESGGCASLADARAESLAPGVRVELQDEAGDCARWLLVSADDPRDHVPVRIDHAGGSAEAAVAMGSERGLSVAVRRRGNHVEATIGGGAEGETVRVVAYHDSGEVELTERGGTYVGAIDSRGPVGVVARSGTLAGAAALAGASRGPAAIVVPSHLAVPMGGAPRVAAFLVVVDARGRLSRNVPLRVESERGMLRRLDWLEPGLAAVSLSVRSATASTIDLTVSSADSELASAELEVSAGWPTRGEVALVAEPILADEALAVRASVATLEGHELDAERVRVTCPDGTVVGVDPEGAAACAAGGAGPAIVAVHAMVDGRPVPLAHARVEVRESAPLASTPSEPEPERPLAVATVSEEELPGLRVALSGRGDVDVWGRLGAGAGLRLDVPIADGLTVGPVARYGLTSIRAQPADDRIVVDLDGERHSFALGGHGTLSPSVGVLRLLARGELSAALRHDRGTLGNAESGGVSLVPRASVAFGAALGAGGGLFLEATLGASATFLQPDRAWPDAPLLFFLEVSGALAP